MASMSIILFLHPDEQVPRGPPDALHELDLVPLELVVARLVHQLDHPEDPSWWTMGTARSDRVSKTERLRERGGVSRSLATSLTGSVRRPWRTRRRCPAPS
jgi:hypothetical protein